MHRFVREKGNVESIPKPQKHCIAIENGRIARETYENVLLMPTTSQSSGNVKTEIWKKNRKSHRKLISPFDKNKLFRASTSNDVPTIEHMKLNIRNVNETDQFGWTALMMAACEGHLDVIKVLLRFGARVECENNKRDTALTLAEKRKHWPVVEFLKQTLALSDPICLSSDDEHEDDKAITCKSNNKIETFFCDTCQAEFSQTDRKSHTASTLHRFNRSDTQQTGHHFGIPETNVGFRMLLQQGWNRESGLGAERNGIMYPIETTLRKPRSGLGTRQPAKPKVTHFKAFDSSAVKSTKPPSILNVKTKRQMRAEKQRSQRKDRYLRKLLS